MEGPLTLGAGQATLPRPTVAWVGSLVSRGAGCWGGRDAPHCFVVGQQLSEVRCRQQHGVDLVDHDCADLRRRARQSRHW